MEISEEKKVSLSRSGKLGVDRNLLCSSSHMPQKDFEHFVRNNKMLPGEVVAIIKKLLVSDKVLTEAILLFVNGNGYVLFSIKDGLVNEPFTVENGDDLGEKAIGTTAISLCLKLKLAVQCEGNDHYLNILSSWSSSASPVFDYNNRLLGVLGLIEKKKRPHKHTLGLLNVLSDLVSDILWNRLIQKQLNDERQYAFDIINNLSYGLFAINPSGKIHWVNDTACRSLNIRRSNLINRDVDDLLPEWNILQRRLDADEKITDEEYVLSVFTDEEKYLLNAYSVKGLTGNSVGYVITIRPFSRMVKMLGRYSLNSAYFTFKDILGQSEAIKNVVAMGRTAAKSPSTILITGESGTGKEVYAQSVHNASNRKDENFVAINCGAISSTLIESELFGYEEGAFTGALKGGRPGKFELANRGTLFLDEIGEMPLEMQVKLLRAIQEKKIVRVGGNKEINVDVRIIAATNKDLTSEMEKGTFRTDLFYRLSVIPISLPSIRQRPEDIPLLLQFFFKQKGQMLAKPIPEIKPKLMKKLLEYNWPGNVRELENTAEKLVLFQGELEMGEGTGKLGKEIEVEQPSFANNSGLKSLVQVEKETIENTLEQLHWNISKAAAILGIGRNTLYDKIKKHGIR